MINECPLFTILIKKVSKGLNEETYLSGRTVCNGCLGDNKPVSGYGKTQDLAVKDMVKKVREVRRAGCIFFIAKPSANPHQLRDSR